MTEECRNTDGLNSRCDHDTIVEWIPKGSRVLDLGCGDGELLARLRDEKNVKGVGLELSLSCVRSCVAKGVSAYQGDLDQGLADLQTGSYDVVVLNQTMSMTRNPKTVIEEARRVGDRLIIGFPNFVYLWARWQMLNGRTPQTKDLPYDWYNSPNFHFVTISDFLAFIEQEQMQVLKTAWFRGDKQVIFWPNLLAESALFELR